MQAIKDVLQKAETALEALESSHVADEVKLRETFDAFASARLFSGELPDDQVLVNRVRSKLWDVISEANRHTALFSKDDVREFEHVANRYGK